MSKAIHKLSTLETLTAFGPVVFSHPFCIDKGISVTRDHTSPANLPYPPIIVSHGTDKLIHFAYDKGSLRLEDTSTSVTISQYLAASVKSVRTDLLAMRESMSGNDHAPRAQLMKSLLLLGEFVRDVVCHCKDYWDKEAVNLLTQPYQDVPQVLELLLKSEKGLCVSKDAIKSAEVKVGNGGNKVRVDTIHGMPAAKFFTALAALECNGVVELVKKGEGNTPKRVAKVTPQAKRWMGLNA